MLPAKRTILLELKTLRFLFFVLHAGVVDPLTLGTLEMYDLAHRSCLVLNDADIWSPRPELNR